MCIGFLSFVDWLVGSLVGLVDDYFEDDAENLNFFGVSLPPFLYTYTYGKYLHVRGKKGKHFLIVWLFGYFDCSWY